MTHPTLKYVRNRSHHGNYRRTHLDYIEQLERQGYGCMICRQPPQDGGVLSWDHDHSCCPGSSTCGKCVRGLLCPSCNFDVAFYERVVKVRGRLARIRQYLAQGPLAAPAPRRRALRK